MADMGVKDNRSQGQNLVPKDSKSLVDFVFLKTNKLTLALYLVTNNLNDSEPVKWRLRDLSLKFFSSISVWSKENQSQKQPPPSDSFKFLDEIVFLLNVTRSQGSVSSMNLDVLLSEYSSLRNQISTIVSGFTLLDFSDTHLVGSTERQIVTDPTFISNHQGEKKQRVNSRKSNDSRPQNQDRQGVILHFLSDKNDWLSIKQIATALPDVSVKTVQRELNVLLEKGAVKREGDRRWSRYLISSLSS